MLTLDEPGWGIYWNTLYYFGNFSISLKVQFSRSVHVWLFVIPWTAAHQASLSITNSWSLLKLMSIVLVMPYNHLILCCPLLLPPSIFPSIRVFSNESVLCIRWPKYWSFSFSVSPSNEYSGLNSLPGAAKSLQSCPILCDHIEHSPPGSPVPRFLQARTLEWVAISFSNADFIA